jgi:hypothetical protein
MKDVLRLAAKTYKLTYEPHSSTNLSRTCEAPAGHKIHFLHAHGKVHLPDIPCEKEERNKKKENEKMRNEETPAA